MWQGTKPALVTVANAEVMFGVSQGKVFSPSGITPGNVFFHLSVTQLFSLSFYARFIVLNLCARVCVCAQRKNIYSNSV